MGTHSNDFDVELEPRSDSTPSYQQSVEITVRFEFPICNDTEREVATLRRTVQYEWEEEDVDAAARAAYYGRDPYALTIEDVVQQYVLPALKELQEAAQDGAVERAVIGAVDARSTAQDDLPF